MRKLLAFFAFVAGLAAAGAAWFEIKYPIVAKPSGAKVESTPERIARGKYLFHHVSSCADCHSDVDFDRFGFPTKPDGLAKGRVWPAKVGLPGDVVSPNITPDKETGVGNWTDGELIRAIREGIGRDGRALFPLMLYTEYREMSDDDLHSIIAYMRTLPPIRNPLPRTKLNFPVSELIKAAPQPITAPVPQPGEKGRYLATIAGCKGCHTPMERGAPTPGMEFAGGREFGTKNSGLLAVSYNITPSHNTGIGTWGEAQFLDKFRQYKDYAAGQTPPLTPGNFTPMPWLYYIGMDEADLKSIYAYLKTVKPVEQVVETRPLAENK